MKKFRVVEENDKYFVEERGWSSLWIWLRWTRFGGSFGNEDISFNSVGDAVSAIKKTLSKPTKAVVWQS